VVPEPEVSVIAPLFDNAATVAGLCARVHAALDPATPHEIVLVVDACPRGSAEAVARVAAGDPRVRGLALARRSGQHVAVLTGIREARGRWLVVMDGDLQDPPEAIPALVGVLRGGRDAAFAARRGRYQSAGRRLTSRAYRWLRSRLTGLPRDVGMFFAMPSGVADRVLALRVAHPYVVAMVAQVAATIGTVPVARGPRPVGRSAYSGPARFRAALSSLRCIAELRSPSRERADWRVSWKALGPGDRLG
jgi:polyisoprenyl-phosphate glycosyltransferase